MTKQKDIIFIKDDIPSNVQDNTIFNITTKDVNPYTHGFHKYPAKFIPQIPKWAIKKYLDGHKHKTVFDPFCGSGTTLVESNISGNNAIGIDIDPLSALISKVKTTSINEDLLNKIVDWVIKEMSSNCEGTFIPSIPTLNHWFTDEAIKKLSKIRTIIDNVPVVFGQETSVKDIQDLLFICFSSIIRRTSNADNESHKTYVSHTKIKVPEEVNMLFLNQLNYFKERIIEFSRVKDKGINSKVIISSSSKSLDETINNHHR